MVTTRISKVIATQEVIATFRARFACRRCGNCCNNFTGVKVTMEEAEHVPMPAGETLDLYEAEDGAYYMKEPCRFYSAELKGCSIYNERPQTCRIFPLHTEDCEDGHVHLAVADMCPAALEALAQVEAEWAGR